MAIDSWLNVILVLWMSMDFLLGSAEDLLPPSNITFNLDEMFCLQWKWNPPENTLCTKLKYTSNVISDDGNQTTSRRGSSLSTTVHIENVDLNKKFRFDVKAECEGTNMTSESSSLTIQLAKGDPNTWVRNLNCVWYNLEYFNCTWEPGQDAPPNVNYSLLYWRLDYECNDSTFEIGRQFQDSLYHGKPCQTYTYSNAIPTGCQFRFQDKFNNFVKIVIVVADWSKNITPYFYYVQANNIVKFKPPVIQDAYRTKNQTIYITWNDLKLHDSMLHEVLLEMSNSNITINYKDIKGLSKEVPDAQFDVTYTIKVRVRLPQDAVDENMYLWSDWSEAKILPGQDGGRMKSLLLFLLIPAVVIVAAVLLLIYMKRLKILIFPRIPDPRRVLSNDLQQWIKSGRTVYSEPKKEEICPVSLLESSLTSPYVD